MSLPGRNISMGKVTIAASGASPSPATAFVMTPTKSARVRVTVGIPCASSLAAARPHAVAQDPQAALPMMTASTRLCLTCAAVSSEPITALPCGKASSGSTSIPWKSASSSDFRSGSMRYACHWSLLTKPTRLPSREATRGANGCFTSIAPDGSWNSRLTIEMPPGRIVCASRLYDRPYPPGGVDVLCGSPIRWAMMVTGLHRWTRHEYARLMDHHVLDEDDPVELLDGLLLAKEPQHSRHRTAVLLAAKTVERAFGEGWFVQTQSPIVLDDRSEPEPDVCVVRGSPRDYVTAHPSHPALIVEVAQSGLHLARGRKAVAYARARIADYWILNLVDRVLEVHREPRRLDRGRWSYASVKALGADATASALAAPGGIIRIVDLLR